MISVIIPAYNVEKYIERCVNSIIAQTYHDWEIILIDDGSSDSTLEICNVIASRCNNIYVYHQENQGVSAARNFGFDHSHGAYIIFVDADDWLEKDMFETLMQGKDNDMMVCNFNRVYDEQNIECIDMWSNHQDDSFITPRVYYEILCNTGTLWNKIIKRDVIGEIRFEINQSYAEDCCFLSRILANTKNCYINRKPLYNYYINRPGNVVSAEIDERSINYLDNAKIIYDIVSANGYSSCGIYRLQLIVWDVLYKIPDLKTYKKYFLACARTMKYPVFRDRIVYFYDDNIPLSKKSRFYSLFYAFFPRSLLRVSYRKNIAKLRK